LDPRSYSRLAAIIFAAIALLQFCARCLRGRSHGVPIPLFVSGIACFVAAVMAWLGFAAGVSRSALVPLARHVERAMTAPRRVACVEDNRWTPAWARMSASSAQ
jgi:hypothetical protein